ncbi:molecular chaperone DnaJ [Parafrankia irregularis]|uniref:Molecular chaperone DnaJ n=1 Tax=Parafrankia irregularis TaxID=795642 RepID=A0A0S4QV48_9ACTN|nr:MULTISPECIES: J domain-containing protein [Frankiaceae]KPM50809.1 molecular chaperone DnaJ [Frankia sp. R43]MBE3204857.1 J domain-containing protein [Parafrankia sp. CH37]CUU59204.1 molecular chaperone DnaJ [Parafrankia irregularis]
MATDQDPYRVLGVEPSASASRITHAYRTLIRRHHPDTRKPAPQAAQSGPHQNHDAALQQVIAAYTVLRDPSQRADYDASRAAHARRDHDRLAQKHSQPARSAWHTGPPVFLGDVTDSHPPPRLWITVR